MNQQSEPPTPAGEPQPGLDPINAGDEPADVLSLADWRRNVAELYAAVRNASAAEPALAWQTFRAGRDGLFKQHPQSPLDAAQREIFTGLDYYPYDPAWRLVGTIEADAPRETLHLRLPEGEFRYSRVARATFRAGGLEARLSLFWVEGYGGGLFLPFADATTGQGTYGGGRYLYDTIKGADLGVYPDRIVLDFNYAYNPSCAYNNRWVCPLSPRENRLPFAIAAGEKDFKPVRR